MSYRRDASLDARRAALEELRTAHFILLGAPPESAFAAFMRRIEEANRWRGSSSTPAEEAEVHAETEVRQACNCVRRALALMDGSVRIEVMHYGRSTQQQLHHLVLQLFADVRDSDPMLGDVEPLEAPDDE